MLGGKGAGGNGERKRKQLLQHVNFFSGAVGALGIDPLISAAGHGRPSVDGAAGVICAEVAGCGICAREERVH